MKTLRFMGCSDDTFGDETTGVDYDNCASGEPITFRVSSGERSLYVTGRYSPMHNGCWEAALCQTKEDMDPGFPVRVGFDGYSAVIEVDVPDDAAVEHVRG